jgi:hypothetical protein
MLDHARAPGPAKRLEALGTGQCDDEIGKNANYCDCVEDDGDCHGFTPELVSDWISDRV